MELNLKKTPVESLVEALNKVSEQPVDFDFTLPDYCPDIEKILRCKITPKIYSRTLSGGQLDIEGASVISVLYEDNEKGAVRVCEQSIPFSADFRINDVNDDYIIETSVKCEYVNCRALSRRRLTIHGAFSLYVKIYTKGEINLYSVDDIENVEFKTKKITVSALKALSGEQFSVGDEIQITGQPPVELIIDSDVKARVTDYKIIPDKLMLNGELNVRALYLSNTENPKPSHLDYIIPFSEIVDCSGLGENDTVCVNLSLLSYDLSLKSDILSENPLINFDARLCAGVICYASREAEIAEDAYSTEYCSEPEFAGANVPVLTKTLSETVMRKDTLSVEKFDVAEVLDFNASSGSVSTSISDKKLIFNSRVNINILAYDSDNSPVYIERAIDVCEEIALNEDYNDVVCASMLIVSLSYRLGDSDTIETRLELTCAATLQQICHTKMVQSINIDENNRLPQNTSALTLYYAQAGEKIWEIAKLYNTKQSLINSENLLSSEELEEPLMLLIPTV